MVEAYLACVYRDYDDNGAFNGTDVGISGQNVLLVGTDVNGNAVSMSAVTQSDGSFGFTAVPESSGAGYTLTQPLQPSSTISGFTTAGSTGGVASGKASVPSNIAGLSLNGANTVSVNNLFGEIYVAPPAVAAIPTFSEWGEIVLSGLMLLFGMGYVRRRESQNPA